jgi:uncharacterized protein YkwD
VKAKTNTKKPVGFKYQLHHHFKMALVPHAANQYRPHLVRRTGLLLVVVSVVAVQLYGAIVPGAVLGARRQISETELLSATNQQRRANGLSPLVSDNKLASAALLKAQDMLKQQYWAHTSPDGMTPWHWFDKVGYNYTYAGENLAKGFASSGAVVSAWMASLEHRANILDVNYTQAGFAVVEGVLNSQPTILVVALYGKPVSPLAVVAPVVAAPQVKAAPQQEISLGTRIVMAAKSFTLPALLILTILTVTSAVATTAHFYRKKLPKNLRLSWYRHHGLYKTFGLLSIAIVVISLYSGGQI